MENNNMARANLLMVARKRRRASLPIGYCFHPSDQQIIMYFLYKKIKGRLQECSEMIECDIYGEEEYWTALFEQQQVEPLMNENEKSVMYLFTKLRKKGTEKGKRWDRRTGSGTWRTQRDDPITLGRNRHVGSKRSFKFIPKEKEEARMRGWIMHEYRIDGELLPHIEDCKDNDYVVCRIKKDRETKKMMRDSSSSRINNHEQSRGKDIISGDDDDNDNNGQTGDDQVGVSNNNVTHYFNSAAINPVITPPNDQQGAVYSSSNNNNNITNSYYFDANMNPVITLPYLYHLHYNHNATATANNWSEDGAIQTSAQYYYSNGNRRVWFSHESGANEIMDVGAVPGPGFYDHQKMMQKMEQLEEDRSGGIINDHLSFNHMELAAAEVLNNNIVNNNNNTVTGDWMNNNEMGGGGGDIGYSNYNTISGLDALPTLDNGDWHAIYEPTKNAAQSRLGIIQNHQSPNYMGQAPPPPPPEERLVFTNNVNAHRTQT